MFEAWADGSVRNGNPGIGGIGVYVEHDGQTVTSFSRVIGTNKTNNEVEYESFIAAVEYLISANEGGDDCIINVDSALVHGQLVKNWKCNYDHLRVLRDRAKRLIREAPFSVVVRWDRRSTNEAANSLAQAVTLEEKERLR